MKGHCTDLLIRSREQLSRLFADPINGIRIGEHKIQYTGYSVIPLDQSDFDPCLLEVWIPLTGGYYWSAAKFIGIRPDGQRELQLINRDHIERQGLDQLIKFCRSNNPNITSVRFLQLDQTLIRRYWDTIVGYFQDSYSYCSHDIPELIKRSVEQDSIMIWGLIDQDDQLLALNGGEVVEVCPTLKVGWIRYSLARQNSGLTALTKYWTIQQLFGQYDDVYEILTHSALGNSYRMNQRLGFVSCDNNILYLDMEATINRGAINKTVLRDRSGVEHVYNSSTNMVLYRPDWWIHLPDRLDWSG